jgi:maltose/moltooligosaccharide transporter
MKHVLHNNRLLAVQIGGGLMLLAALLCYLLVDERKKTAL